MRLIDADALRNALNDAGGTGAERGGWADGWCKAIDAAIRMLEKAPTVEPEPQWIPVTERLPENEGDFIVTANDLITGLFIAKDYCYKGTDGKMRFLNQIDGNLYHNHDGELKRHTRNIAAWMPLPEPYKPEKIEDDDD